MPRFTFRFLKSFCLLELENSEVERSQSFMSLIYLEFININNNLRMLIDKFHVVIHCVTGKTIFEESCETDKVSLSIRHI